MRLTKLSVFAFLLLTSLTFPTLSLRAQNTDDSSAGQRGTAPRSSADKYHSHATNEGVSIGAELLSRKEVSQELAAPLNRCCLVVQVAVYPITDEPLEISLDDFALIVGDTDMPVRPESATVISAKVKSRARRAVLQLQRAQASDMSPGRTLTLLPVSPCMFTERPLLPA